MSVVNTCRALLRDRELEVELPPTLCSLRPPLNFRGGATQRPGRLSGSGLARACGGGVRHKKAQDTCTARDLSALPDEIEIEDEEEGKKRRYHHRVIETNADQYRKLIL